MNYLDIGAADFELPQRWQLFKNQITPILFEPDIKAADKLKSHNFQVYNVALGKTHEKRDLLLTQKPQCSSFFRPNIEYLNTFPDSNRFDIIGKTTLDIVPLDSLKIKADFIKIDTQGSELEILSGATNTLKNTLALEVEVSFHQIYEGQPLFQEIQSFLLSNNFEFLDFVSEYRYNKKNLSLRSGQLAFADALFIKSPKLINDPEDIVHYNQICQVYNKYDWIIE